MPTNPEPGYVLVVSHDVVGERMAGPGIRYYQLARVLSREFRVILAVPCPPPDGLPAGTLSWAQFKRGEWGSLEPLVRNAKAVLLNSEIAGDFPQLADLDNPPLVIDGYDPLLIEWLTLTQSDLQMQTAHWQARMLALNRQYLAGDFFICASERQRDWWLGLLEANGRINPWTVQADPTLRRLIDVVPFGLPETPLQADRRVLKGVWSGIGEGDKVILWGGGLWPWLDPLTAVKGIARVWGYRQDVRLVFPGTRHPNPAMAQIPTHVEAVRQEASRLGLLDRAVFLGEWVDYAHWPGVLADSDLALSLHYAGTLETRLAFRTRILDYIWAGLPVVATQGDATGELVEAHQLGLLVPSEDVERVSEAILRLLEVARDSYADRFAAARAALTWERAAQPLFEFFRQPQRLPDKAVLGERLGNPYYQAMIDRLAGENAQLHHLIAAYEGRRVVRLANWLSRFLAWLGLKKM
jgi:glycosyltransferase involved in cell wall biosynthesis